MSRYCVGGLMINCSPMPASDFEFRNRFLLVSAVFCLGFAAYRIDHVNVVERVLMWLITIRNLRRAYSTLRRTSARISSFDFRSFFSRWIGLVARKRPAAQRYDDTPSN